LCVPVTSIVSVWVPYSRPSMLKATR
jgi:hypothetical protein